MRPYPGLSGCQRTFWPMIGFHIASQPLTVGDEQVGQITSVTLDLKVASKWRSGA